MMEAEAAGTVTQPRPRDTWRPQRLVKARGPSPGALGRSDPVTPGLGPWISDSGLRVWERIVPAVSNHLACGPSCGRLAQRLLRTPKNTHVGAPIPSAPPSGLRRPGCPTGRRLAQPASPACAVCRPVPPSARAHFSHTRTRSGTGRGPAGSAL